MLSICSQCRIFILRSVLPRTLPAKGPHCSRRCKSQLARDIRGQHQHSPFLPSSSKTRDENFTRPRSRPVKARPTKLEFRDTEHSDAAELLISKVPTWIQLPFVHLRLERFGIPRRDVRPLLSSFASAVEKGLLEDPVHLHKIELDRLAISATESNKTQRLDEVLTQLFYTWASDPDKEVQLQHRVPPSTLEQIRQLYEAADMSYPAEESPKARSMNRKIIMHVGPTNSGKTHNALRALAAARMGIYAGPLRLLAHEIWERFNKGQIVPLGVDVDEGASQEIDSKLDILAQGGVSIRRTGTKKFARACNLKTGEEIRIVDDNAGLFSCTVEMLPQTLIMDVAVVDEIQMIADPFRGFSWTRAVLDLNVKELHLCGEETAIPIVEALVRDTGDELVINRYQRLTPLIVEKESLNGDITKIRKGDCLVTFSRSGIFALKQKVEQQTGLRCAVAYGRLPPEIRSEQASLFNDPTSGYDVIIGSDAIGMGLNLKINRIVFEQLHKFDGRSDQPLSVSQIKQIAGRAGRYGLQSKPGGYVTTLHARDLPILQAAISAPAPPLLGARIQPAVPQMATILQALPVDATIETLCEVPIYVTKTYPPYRLSVYNRLSTVAEFIDTHARDFSLRDKCDLLTAPVTWQDPLMLPVIAQYCSMFRDEIRVPVLAGLNAAPLMSKLREVESAIDEGDPTSPAHHRHLRNLETLHKALIFYLWMSIRNPIAYYQREEALQLKDRTEKALQWVLDAVSWTRRRRDVSRVPNELAEDAIPYHGYRSSSSSPSDLKHTEHLRGLEYARTIRNTINST